MKNGKLTIREMAVFAMLGTLMYASKMIMEVAPNVHLLGAFTKKSLENLLFFL